MHHLELNVVKVVEVQFLEVRAEVRYWEDASVDGVEDADGTLIPFREGDLWTPIIDLDAGIIRSWPEGKQASIHYKVCDQGQYWLLDPSGERVAKWKGYYVPDAFLCQSGDGYGDYIIMEVDDAGKIANWRLPALQSDDWEPAF